MAIRDIFLLGFGNGTFSPGVNKLPTLGYAIAAAVATAGPPYTVDAQDSYNAGAVTQDLYNAGAVEQEGAS